MEDDEKIPDRVKQNRYFDNRSLLPTVSLHALRRELREEAGITECTITDLDVSVSYPTPRGLTHNLHLCLVTGVNMNEIHIADNSHTALGWVTYDQLIHEPRMIRTNHVLLGHWKNVYKSWQTVLCYKP